MQDRKLNIQISQGSVAADLGRGGRFYSSICAASQNARVQQILQ